MAVILEIRDGAMAGKKIAIVTGRVVTFGRARERAQFALPHDTFMSGVHFAVECGTSGCRVQDRKSSNGTFLNGARIQDAMLANGDEIKGGQTIFAVKIVADAKLASLMPAQDVSLPSAAQPKPPAVEQVPPSAAWPQPPVDAPSPPQSRPRAAEPVPPAPSAPESRPFASERASPLVPPSARSQEERKPALAKDAPEPPLSERARGESPEPPSSAMRAGDLDGAAEPRPTRDAGVEPPAHHFEPSAGPADRDFSGVPGPHVSGLPPKEEPLGGGLSPSAGAPAKKAPPPVEEPPHLRAIPSPPGVGGQQLRGGENRPGVGANPPRGVENTPGAGAKPPRVSEPPAGVAPYIAQKFAERPGSRGVGSSRGAAFSVMGWSFPAAPAEWLVQEGFGLQQSGHEDFPGSVAASEELLGGITLQQFVESQISMLRGYLRDPKIEPTMPPRVGEADESMAMDVRHSTKDGRELVYRRIYARSGSSVGVLTVTTLAADFPQVLETLQALLDGAAFRATVNY